MKRIRILSSETFAKCVEQNAGDILKRSSFGAAMKRLVDILFSAAFLLLFSWLYLIIWLLISITSRGPAFYSQPRLGRKGIEFKFYKFRSMFVDADHVLEDYLKHNPTQLNEWNEFQKIKFDPRITRIGSYLRKTSLDELPQFWNVFIGDMSLVGPRPCLISQKSRYGDSWQYYCLVRPGITGLWQVSGRNKLSFSRRVELDVLYVQSSSFILDVRIFFKTIWVVLTGHGSQ